MHKLRFPSPALVIALVALFVALSGTAVAAGIVPLAKRALTADNAKHAVASDKAKQAIQADSAKKLDASAANAIAQQAAQLPGPASSAAGITSVKSASGGQLAPMDARPFQISCDPGMKIMGAGYSTDGPVLNVVESYPTGDASWSLGLLNLSESTPANVTVYATCIK